MRKLQYSIDTSTCCITVEFFNLMLELKLIVDEKADIVAFLRVR